ncbi:MAG: hypothetical protein NZL88_08185 [Gaiellaceae bacterium]|nr:hypothetical protein [Gaiellaceae bacterium]
MVVLGVAAPEISAVALTRSDGSASRTALGPNGEFAIELSADELERGALPAAISAYGRGVRLLDRIQMPVPR